MKILSLIFVFLDKLHYRYKKYSYRKTQILGYRANNAYLGICSNIKGLNNIYLYENTTIGDGATILATRAKFIMKKNSAAGDNLTIITGNHMSKVGYIIKDVHDGFKTPEYDQDVIVEEDVWLATNVTLLSGVKIGRGAIIGSGSVCRKSIPPYAIVIGNPAKVVSFKFLPEQIIEHEKLLYTENERYDLEVLQQNYNKYFVKKIREIKSYIN